MMRRRWLYPSAEFCTQGKPNNLSSARGLHALCVEISRGLTGREKFSVNLLGFPQKIRLASLVLKEF